MRPLPTMLRLLYHQYDLHFPPSDIVIKLNGVSLLHMRNHYHQPLPLILRSFNVSFIYFSFDTFPLFNFHLRSAAASLLDKYSVSDGLQ